MPYGINCEGGNAARSKRGCNSKWTIVLIVSKAVSEDGYGPTGWWLRSSGENEIKVNIFGVLNSRQSVASWNGRNEPAGCLKIKRCESSKGKCAYRAGKNLQGRRRHWNSVKHTGCGGLLS